MPIVNGLEREFGDEVTFFRLNAAEPDVVRIQQAYGLRGHPAVAILDSDGMVTARYFGAETSETLQGVLEGLLEK